MAKDLTRIERSMRTLGRRWRRACGELAYILLWGVCWLGLIAAGNSWWVSALYASFLAAFIIFCLTERPEQFSEEYEQHLRQLPSILRLCIRRLNHVDRWALGCHRVLAACVVAGILVEAFHPASRKYLLCAVGTAFVAALGTLLMVSGMAIAYRSIEHHWGVGDRAVDAAAK